jgi:cyclic pyranopterin phosphate synthase
MRKGLTGFIAGLRRHLRSGGLDEITLTTNGAQLALHAEALAAAGVKRINVSLDTLDRETFARIARRDRLPQVLEGIEAARQAGLKVKINTVALRRDNGAELPALIRWAHARAMDITLIETMPLGEIEEDRTDQYLPLSEVRRGLEQSWTLCPDDYATGGPARYVRVRETGGRVGFITPISNVFCATCNRVRLTCTGRLFLCLGRDASIDLAALLRGGANDDDLEAALEAAIARKPEAHDFRIAHNVRAVERHMSVTGG